MKLVKRIEILFFCVISSLTGFSQTKPVYQDATRPMEERIEDALSRMTVEEKVRLLHANGGYRSWGVPRLGIPDNNPTDGPVGLRPEMEWSNWNNAHANNDSCTAFPSTICLAATWNPEMGVLFGKAYSEEALYRNKNIILGPGVNIFRTPMNGRNFEYMGEDPYLASKMGVSYIQGVQSNHVAACVKHFAVNNQETNRNSINTLVDERALHEIYLPAFKAAVQEGKVWTVMGAYNQYNGQHCCHNKYLLEDILRKEWGFDGVLLSDFGGTHNTEEAIFNGLDLEYGTRLGSAEAFNKYYLADPYLKLIREGKVGEKELNEKVRRILRMMYRTNMSADRPWGSLASAEHIEAARRIAEEGIVLLQNKKNMLPLNPANLKKILVVGENAVRTTANGGGSSEVQAKYEVVPLEGIRNWVGQQTEIVYQAGYSSRKGVSADSLKREAVQAAKEADAVVFIGGLAKEEGLDSEGADRKSYELPYGQNDLISALADANPRLVAVMISGNAYAMPWLKEVPAILQAWYGGTESGNAIASVLFGKTNPSGKLPFTFPARLEDNAAHAMGAYPGDGKTVEYKEGIWVGYRWTEKEKIQPLFAFGHGLSYTTFKYGKISLSKEVMNESDQLVVTIPVTNTGSCEGAETVQLYINDQKASLPRPVKELKGFRKVRLTPGETCNVSFVVDKESLSYYDPVKHGWVAEPGKFQALVGSASDDIKAKVIFELK